jgi:uncharacterized protein YkwD
MPLPIRDQRSVSTIPAGALGLLVTLTGAGCGRLPTDVLGAAVEDGNEMPPNVYCSDVAGWDPTWIALEDEVLELVNERRAEGADCGSPGSFEPAGPLTMNAALCCAARRHARDMGTRDYFDHFSPEGDGPGERFDRAGYEGSTWGENIAWGYASPAAVVSGWMDSPGHCANIMNARFTEMGVGYYEGNLWTQAFGRAAP